MRHTRRHLLRSSTLFCLPLIGKSAQSLFNGRDFTGWHKAANGIWTIEDGAIVGRFDRARPGPGYVFTNREFANFDLRLEFWISKGGNSGVYVRQPLRVFGPIGDARPTPRVMAWKCRSITTTPKT